MEEIERGGGSIASEGKKVGRGAEIRTGDLLRPSQPAISWKSFPVNLGYRVASATEGSLESSRRKIGVFTGSSTSEPLVMNASQSLFAAPKYPKPIAVPADACAAPAPSKPKPFRPSPDRDHAVFCVVESATALDGPISEAGARSRAKVEVVALISPS